MEKDSKIYVAGHREMAGSAIVRELQRQGGWHCRQPEHSCRLHVRQHDFGDERHPCRLAKWL